MTDARLLYDHIAAHGWTVRHAVGNGSIVITAEKPGEQTQTVLCRGADDPDQEYACACELAEACGFDLADD